MMSLVEKLRAAERRLNPESAEAFLIPLTAQQTAFLIDVARVLAEASDVLNKPIIPPHCATCQCNKFPPTPPMPENPRSRSWHQNAMTEPPK